MNPSNRDFLPWIKKTIQEHAKDTSDRAVINLATSGISTAVSNDWLRRVLERQLGDVTKRFQEENEFGLPSLINAIRSTYALPVDRLILLTAGATGGFRFVFESLFSDARHGNVVIESPVYEPLTRIPACFGQRLVPVPRGVAVGSDEFVANIAAAITSETRAVILTNLHNPTGDWLSDEATSELIAAAKRKSPEISIIVDETFRDLGPNPFTTAANLDPCVITISSLTKSYGLGGIRCGWVTADPARHACFVNDWALFEGIGAKLLEVLGVLAFSEIRQLGESARHQLSRNRLVLSNWVAEMQAAGFIDGASPEQGCVYFPRWNGSLPVNELMRRLDADFLVLVAPGVFFGTEWENHFRIGFGGAPQALADGLGRLAEGLRFLVKTS